MIPLDDLETTFKTLRLIWQSYKPTGDGRRHFGCPQSTLIEAERLVLHEAYLEHGKVGTTALEALR